MNVAAVAVALLLTSGVAWGQSLLGTSDRSPYDPPRRPAYKKHDHVRVVVSEKGETAALEVADVRPNGTLVLQGVRRRKVDGREETVRISGEAAASSVERGVVRMEDLEKLTVGVEGVATTASAGWLARVLGRLWPF